MRKPARHYGSGSGPARSSSAWSTFGTQSQSRRCNVLFFFLHKDLDKVASHFLKYSRISSRRAWPASPPPTHCPQALAPQLCWRLGLCGRNRVCRGSAGSAPSFGFTGSWCIVSLCHSEALVAICWCTSGSANYSLWVAPCLVFLNDTFTER